MDNLDLDNTLYYTFSTISQTLAGALGLLAAFMITRVSAFNHLIAERVKELYDWVGGEQDMMRNYLHGNAEAVLHFYRTTHDRVKREGGTGNPTQPFLNSRQEAQLIAAEGMIERKKKLLAGTRDSLLLSAATILFSLVCLIVTPYLHKHAAWTYTASVLGVAGAAVCMASYVKLIMIALKES